MRDTLELVYPSLDYADGYLAARAEGFRDTSSGADRAQITREMLPEHFARLQRPGQPIVLADGTVEEPVPFGRLWLVSGGMFIGRVGVRYHLNRSLRRSGGHVGYEIRPALQRRGFGHAALALGRAHLAIHGTETILVTCAEGNIGSQRIIEAAGGRLEDLVASPDGSGTPIRRYWFGTPAPEQAWPGLAMHAAALHDTVKLRT